MLLKDVKYNIGLAYNRDVSQCTFYSAAMFPPNLETEHISSVSEDHFFATKIV